MHPWIHPRDPKGKTLMDLKPSCGSKDLTCSASMSHETLRSNVASCKTLLAGVGACTQIAGAQLAGGIDIATLRKHLEDHVL